MVIVYKVVAEGFFIFFSSHTVWRFFVSGTEEQEWEIFISADNKQLILSQIWGLAGYVLYDINQNTCNIIFFKPNSR